MGDIKVGDLVMVVSGTKCCGTMSGKEGAVFTTTGVYFTDGNDRCLSCGDNRIEACWSGHASGFAIPENRLKKIDPPADDTEIIREKEIENV